MAENFEKYFRVYQFRKKIVVLIFIIDWKMHFLMKNSDYLFLFIVFLQLIISKIFLF